MAYQVWEAGGLGRQRKEKNIKHLKKSISTFVLNLLKGE